MKRILLNVTVVSLLVVLGCLGASADNNTTIGFPKTAFAYALMVEPELGVPPRVNLDKSVEIPLYISRVFRPTETLAVPATIRASWERIRSLDRHYRDTKAGLGMASLCRMSFGLPLVATAGPATSTLSGRFK